MEDQTTLEGAEESGLRALEGAIGYSFKDRGLLQSALTHPSVAQNLKGRTDHFQRLEFLGDSVISFVLAEALFRADTKAREGTLSRQRAALACSENLCQLARELNLATRLHLGHGEESTGGRGRRSILEDALEALAGAVFLDAGWEEARRVVLSWFGDLEERLAACMAMENPKGKLQECVQAVHGVEVIDYRVVDVRGPAHARHFSVEVHILDTVYGAGAGSSKKEAEEEAAREALTRWPSGQTVPVIPIVETTPDSDSTISGP